MGQVFKVRQLGQPEVGDPHRSPAVHEQVARLDVAMQRSLLMGVLEGVGHLDADLRHAPPKAVPGRRRRGGRRRRRRRRGLLVRRRGTARRRFQRRRAGQEHLRRRRGGKSRRGARRRGRGSKGLGIGDWGLEGRHSGRSLIPNPQSPIPSFCQGVNDPVQSLPGDELHHVIVDAVLAADAEDRDDVRVVEPGRRLRLAKEALQPRGRGLQAAGRAFRATCRPSDSCSAS